MVTPDGPLVIGLNGALLIRGRAVVDLWWLARSAADQASRRDGIVLSVPLRSLLDALEREARTVTSSVVPETEFRRSVPEASSDPDDEITSHDAARLLHCTERYVRYRAAELGGRKRAGRWVFSRSQVLEHERSA
jgi:hypothetical protein